LQVEPLVLSLAYGLSQMSVYFMMYLLNLGFLSWLLGLFRFGYWISKWMGSVDNNFYFAWTYPPLMIGLTLCITYGSLSPFIWIIGVLYFGIGYMVCTYQLSMCFINSNEMGLQIWPAIFTRLIIGIEIGNVTVLAYVALSEAIGPSILLLLLIVIVYLVWRKMNKKFERLFYRRDTRFAHHVDKMDEKYPQKMTTQKEKKKQVEEKKSRKRSRKRRGSRKRRRRGRNRKRRRGRNRKRRGRRRKRKRRTKRRNHGIKKTNRKRGTHENKDRT